MIGSVRIISGQMRGKKLIIPPSEITRPSSDRTREAIFSTIESFLSTDERKWQHLYFMDCFSGSGAFAAEALSRGAYYVTLAENNPEALKVIKHNLSLFPKIYQDRYSVYKDVFALPIAKKSADIIFMDPPYGKNLIPDTLKYLVKQHWINSKTVIITESSKEETIDFPDYFTIIKEKFYGRAKVNFLNFNPVCTKQNSL